MKLITLAIFVASFTGIFAERARYDVYHINVETRHQLKILQDLEINRDGIQFMDTPNKIPMEVEIIVPPHKFAHISELFEMHYIKYLIKIDDLQKLMDKEQPDQRRADFNWKQYNDLPAFNEWMDGLLERYPNVVSGYVFGQSYENRPLRAIRISHQKGNPTIFIESTIHAREWITAATLSYFMNELLTSSDAEIRALADNYDWVVVPVYNVDGYDYTHTKNRMRRKNRKPSVQSPSCISVDLNRNFDFHHGDVGSSSQPCAEIYAGPSPASEPETVAITKFIASIENLKLYISFHSYSQLLMFPYGHTTEHAYKYNDMLQVGQATIKAISQRYGTQYQTGNIAETIYLASGSSIDWVYAVRNVSLTYTFEFRDKGNEYLLSRHGFILPADQIIPNSLEVIDGLKAMIKEAKSLDYL